MISILDIGVSNIGSVQRMLERLEVDTEIIDKNAKLEKCDAIIIPGVGSFDQGIKRLRGFHSFNIIENKVLVEKVPVLGICLGMQMMTNGSEEGTSPGLGWIAADTKKIISETHKIPNMGWRKIIYIAEKNSTDIEYSEKYYFTHSYHVQCQDANDILMKTNEGIELVAAFKRNNIMGVQFHPEKSHQYGFKFFNTWIKSLRRGG